MDGQGMVYHWPMLVILFQSLKVLHYLSPRQFHYSSN